MDLNNWTLCFNDPTKEHGFLRVCRSRLLSAAGAISAIGLLVSVAFILLKGFELAADMLPTHESRLCAWMQIVGCVFAASMLVLVLIFSQCAAIHKFVGETTMESGFVVSIVVVSVASSLFTDAYFLSAWLTASIDDMNPQYHPSDTSQLLVLIAIATSTHAALPIRWHKLLWVQLFAFGPFATRNIIYGSPETYSWLNLGMLVGILGATSYGKRLSDFAHRQQFDNFVTEKTFRFAAEFQLSQKLEAPQASGVDQNEFGGECQSNSKETSTSERSKAATAITTTTGAIFAGIERQKELTNEEDQEKAVMRAMEAVEALGHSERWIVNKDEIEIVPKMIGKGGFGVVVHGKYHGASVALKLMRSPPDICVPRDIESLATELRVLRRLHHPNIVFFHGAVLDCRCGEVGLVLEYISGMSLSKIIRERDFNTSHAHESLCDICCGLRYLHSRTPSVIHGDLKTSNVLVEFSYVGFCAKLVDFGLARITKSTAKGLGGTANYMAPEILLDPKPTTCVDVFSFGRLTFAVVTRREPLTEYSRSEIDRALKRGEVLPLNWPSQGFTRPQSLCDKCLVSDPAERPHVGAVLDEIKAWQTTPSKISFPWQQGVDCLREHIKNEEVVLQRHQPQLIEQEQIYFPEGAMAATRRGPAEHEQQIQIPNVPDDTFVDEQEALEQQRQWTVAQGRVETMLSLPPMEEFADSRSSYTSGRSLGNAMGHSVPLPLLEKIGLSGAPDKSGPSLMLSLT